MKSLAKPLKTRGKGEKTKFGTMYTVLRILGRWEAKEKSEH